MCGGAEYHHTHPQTGQKQRLRVFFPMPHAPLPVMTESGITLMQWGKRQGEDPELDLPVTGWARLSSLVEGKWSMYQPTRVRIPVLRWMEKDAEKTSHWFDLPPEQAMLGVKLHSQGRDVVYVVTHPASAPFDEVHARMPLIVPVQAPSLQSA